MSDLILSINYIIKYFVYNVLNYEQNYKKIVINFSSRIFMEANIV